MPPWAVLVRVLARRRQISIQVLRQGTTAGSRALNPALAPLENPVPDEAEAVRKPRLLTAIAVFGGALIASIAAAVAIQAVLGEVSSDAAPITARGLAAQSVFVGALAAGVVGWALWSQTPSSIRMRLGASPVVSAVMGAALGIGMQIAISGAFWLVQRVFPGFDPEKASGPIEHSLASAPSALKVMMVVLAVIGAPLAEELYFRGMLLSALEGVGPRWIAVGVSSALFALAHANIYAFPAFLALGIALAAIDIRRESLVPSIFAHMAFNGVAVIALLS